tara:strand:+ start:17439 stop:17672 length:234 start_codon:yes stop_codon:yes gene_type:complete
MIKLHKLKTGGGCYEVRYTNNNALLGELYKEVDGFYVFEFDLHRTVAGCFPQRFFEEVAFKLKELNKGWEDELSKSL